MRYVHDCFIILFYDITILSSNAIFIDSIKVDIIIPNIYPYVSNKCRN